MRKALTLFALILAFFSLQVHAQERQITGKVISSQDNLGIPGVTVLVVGTTVGTTTDLDGNFKVGVPADAKQIQISGIGLMTRTLDLTASDVVNVTLEPNIQQLNQVVVTALGVTREQKSLGYATQQVKGDDISLAKEGNFINSLQGRVAGVTISGSSNIGGSSRILLRGVRSISYENQPLFVVDGVPISNGNFTTLDQARGALGYDYGNAAQDINPDDIESINVLKGASATALYGSQGANGVVLITTKKGNTRVSGGKNPIGISISSGVTISEVSVLPEYQNIYGGGAGPDFIVSDLDPTQLRSNFEYDGSWGPKMEGQLVRQWDSYYPSMPNYNKLTPWVAHPDNVKDFFETGVTTNNNVSIDGGSDLTKYRLSYTNFNQKGTVPNSSINRNIFSFSGSNKFTSKVSSSLSVNYVGSNGRGRPQTGYNNLTSNFTQWWERQLDMGQLKDYLNPDGSQRTWNMNSETDLTPLYWDNPYWVAYENYETDQRNRVYGFAGLTYEFTPKLSLSGAIKTDYYNDNRQERIAKGGVNTSEYQEQNIFFNENNYEMKLNYKTELSSSLNLTAFAGANRQDRKTENNFIQTQGGLNAPGYYNLTNSVDNLLSTPDKSRLRRNSVYASASFAYKSFLYLDLTGRNDWSSTLPTGNNSYFYPSATASFLYSEFIKAKWLSLGKLRLGWATTAIDPIPYASTETRPVISSNFAGFATAVVPNGANNADLKPETTSSIEIGTQLIFLEGRISLDFTYYNTTSKDVIFAVQQSLSTGSTSKFYNAAEISNKGIELQLDGQVIKTKSGFIWGLGVNYAKNTNKVEKLFTDENGVETQSLQIQNAPFSATFQARPGLSFGQIVGYDYAYDANGNHIIDGGAYARTAKVQPLGSVLPNFTGGVSTYFEFKGFRLFGLIDFQDGGKLFSMTNMWGKYSGTLKETAEGGIRENGLILEGVNQTGVDDLGNPISDGSPNTTSIAAIDHFFLDGGYVITAADVYDASFIKFRELSLTYALPKKMFLKSSIQGVSISLVGRNLAILHKNVPNIDPESAVSTSNVQGLEGAQLPTERTYGVTLNVRF